MPVYKHDIKELMLHMRKKSFLCSEYEQQWKTLNFSFGLIFKEVYTVTWLKSFCLRYVTALIISRSSASSVY